MKQCSDYEATQKASVGLSHRVLGMLGVHNLETESQPLQSPRQDLSAPPVSVATPQSIPAVADVSGMSALYISTSELGSSPSQHIMVCVNAVSALLNSVVYPKIIPVS